MKNYHIFISHSWSYKSHYYNLTTLLKQAGYFDFLDFSIPVDDPVHTGSDRELSAAIHNKMQSCGIVIVLAGVYASYSKWIDKEIKIAKSGFDRPKSILGIKPYNTVSISTVVKDAASEIVQWNTDSIVAAIRRLG